MSETREPEYVLLDWEEDFKLDAHIDADGQQRFALMGYIQKRRADGIYRAPIIPELFYGVNGQQLDTWSQYLTAGDHTILRRDSGNPSVPDYELAWTKVAEAHPQRPIPTNATVPQAMATGNEWLLVAGGALAIGVVFWYYFRKKRRRR